MFQLGAGIYYGPDREKNRIVGPGDALFGSRVRSAVIGAFPGKYINDQGQVVFYYELETGFSGIAVATPK